ncbi:MAG: DUF3990 domain-containing protein [Lachnospiraceae bacterium]|nr:DUF3990 domain-containing protein [Lachnospiraceae bacterium]
MKVYHGTILNYAVSICNDGIDLNKSNMYLDFGRGFYVTPDIKMAKNMAYRVWARKKQAKNIFPAIVSFEYKENLELNYRKFEYEDVEWAKFIMANRVSDKIAYELGLMDNNRDFRYDIIIGGTADGAIANIASDLRYGRMQPENYKLKLSDFLKEDASSYGTQIVFCTEEALSCIEYIKCDIINDEKR